MSRVTAVADDPDDVYKCALAVNAKIVASGDRYVLGLRVYETMPILFSAAVPGNVHRRTRKGLSWLAHRQKALACALPGIFSSLW